MALSKSKQAFMNEIIPSLKSGVMSLNDLASKIVVVNVSFILKFEGMFAEVRRLIDRAQRNIGLSERTATNELYKIDTYYEEITLKKGQLEGKRRDKSTERNNIEIALRQLRQSVRSAEQSYQAAQREYRNALQRLEDAKWKKHEADKRRELGYGLLAIPIAGWIAGPILIDEGNKNYDNACYMASSAENVVSASANTVQHFSQKISSLSDRSSNLNTKIYQLNWEIEGLSHEISRIKEQRGVAADFQIKMRSATNILGGLAKTTNAAELETKNYICIAALINIVQHVFQLCTKMVGVEFLKDQGLQNLVASLMKHEKKIKEISNVSQKDIEEFV